jgi:hypothetical protein
MFVYVFGEQTANTQFRFTWVEGFPAQAGFNVLG